VVGTSTKAFLKGINTWKKETIVKKVNLPYTPIFFEVESHSFILCW